MGFAMPSLVSAFYDAAVSPEAWPQALSALTDAACDAGAAIIVFNKSTRMVDEVCFSGLSAGFKSDYVSHYAALDPFSPRLDGSWKKLSECLPEPLLRKSEWYNDFVMACGVRDIAGARAYLKELIGCTNPWAAFWLKEAGSISTSTMAAAIRTKSDRFFPLATTPRRMFSFLPGNLRKMGAGSDPPSS